MISKPKKSNKIFEPSVFMVAFTVFMVLLSSGAQATMQTLMEWYPGDYSSDQVWS